MRESIKLDGKYEVVVENNESEMKFYANRYGDKQWRDLTGDKMVMAMFYRIQELEEVEHKYNELCK